jgi:hypothetical protein
MASQPTGISVLAFAAAPVIGDGAPAEGDALTEDDRDEEDDEVEDFVWGGSDDAPMEDDRDDAGDEVENFVWGGLEKTPQKNRNSRMYTVVSERCHPESESHHAKRLGSQTRYDRKLESRSGTGIHAHHRPN